MASISSSPWIRKSKTCCLTNQDISVLDYHYSALIQMDNGAKRMDFHPDVFDQWRRSFKPVSSLLAWWKVEAGIKAKSKKEPQDFAGAFVSLYEQYIAKEPQLVLRFAHLLCKMKLAHIEQLKSGQWCVSLKESIDLESGCWLLPFCRLEKEKEQQHSELIRMFVDKHFFDDVSLSSGDE